MSMFKFAFEVFWVVNLFHEYYDFVIIFSVLVQLDNVAVVEDRLDRTLLSCVMQLVIAEQL